MEKKLALLQGMIRLFQVAGIIVAFMLGLIGLLGVGIGLAGQPSLALLSLFCLSILVIISISAWRMLATAHPLADELLLLPRNVFRVLPLLDRCWESCVVAALVWLVVPICVIVYQGDLPGSMLPTLCLLLLALSFHLPAAALRRTLPLTSREALPFPAGRVLLGVTTLSTAAMTLWCCARSEPTVFDWVLLMLCGLCCLGLALFALRMHPRLLRLSGWGLILLGALLLLFSISSIGTAGWIFLLCLLAFACIPAAVGLWLTVLSDLVSP